MVCMIHMHPEQCVTIIAYLDANCIPLDRNTTLRTELL